LEAMAGPTTTEQPSLVAGGIEVPRSEELPRMIFVGGTGRSGTHVIAGLIARNPRFALVPVEVRFHTDADGFPGLLAGDVSPEQFVRKLRGYWWRGWRRNRFGGLFRTVSREVFDSAVDQFVEEFDDHAELACARLFVRMLYYPRTVGERAHGTVEQSCDTVARAELLLRLFPYARFVHVVRDGRDASASRVSQTHGLIEPRTRLRGLSWWEERILRVEAGAREIPPERLLTVSLDELIRVDDPQAALRPLFRFCGTNVLGRPRSFFGKRMTPERANTDRWRDGVSARKAARIEALYEEALERLEAQEARSAPLLRRTFERSRGADLAPLPYVYDPASR
jgi:hypothetical protein